MQEWAGGLERVGQRRLEVDEHRALLERVSARRRVLGIYRVVAYVVALLVVAPGVGFLLFAPAVGETMVLRLIAALGLMCMIGFIPALVVVPLWRRTRQWLPILARAEAALAREPYLARFEQPGLSLETVPGTGVIVTRNGVAVRTWERLDVVEVAEPSESLEAPWPWPVQGLAPGVTLTQRHMSAEERVELKRHAGRALRRAVATTPVVILVSAWVLRALENALHRQSRNELSTVGWIIALSAGLVALAALMRAVCN